MSEYNETARQVGRFIVDKIEAAHLAGNQTAAIDLVYKELDELLLASRFDEAGAALEAMVARDLPPVLLVCALVEVRPWRRRYETLLSVVADKIEGRVSAGDAEHARRLASPTDGW